MNSSEYQTNASLTSRQRHEEEFHDSRCKTDAFSQHVSGNNLCYKTFWEILSDVRGKTVLDLGCGDGWISLRLGMAGARVFGVDISGELIRKAIKEANTKNLSGSVHFQKMAAEELIFPDRFFDIVLGGSVLHHVDLRTLIPTMAEILKKDGYALFIEPLNDNPLLKLWRFLTPWRRSREERALRASDLTFIQSFFSHATFCYFTFTSIITTGLMLLLGEGRFILSTHQLLERLDAKLAWLFPDLRKYFAVVVVKLVL